MFKLKSNRGSISLAILIFLVTGVIFLSIGIGLRVSDHNKKERCTIKTQAEVVDIVSNTNSDGTTYAPVFSYTVNGEKYVKQRNSYSNPCDYYKGQQVVLYYNPDKPEEFYTDDSVINIFFYVFGGIGAIFVIVSIAETVNLIRVKKRKNSFAQSELLDETEDTEYFEVPR